MYAVAAAGFGMEWRGKSRPGVVRRGAARLTNSVAPPRRSEVA